MKDRRYEIQMLIESIERQGAMSEDVRRLTDIAIELAQAVGMTVNKQAVEAAAEGFYMSGLGGSDKHWEDLPNARKTYFMKRASIALDAAGPHL